MLPFLLLSTVAHNIIMGKSWVDHFGPLTVESSTGWKAHMEMKKCGFMSKNWHVTQGAIRDPSGKLV